MAFARVPQFQPIAFPRLWFCSVLIAIAPACGTSNGQADDADAGHDCAADMRDDVYSPGMAKVGPTGYTVSLDDSRPAPPKRGDNTWTVQVRDPGGDGVSGVDLDISPFMPDHGHGTPIEAEVTEVGAGRYEAAPVNLFMPGLWEITVTPRLEPGALDTVVFRFCIPG